MGDLDRTFMHSSRAEQPSKAGMERTVFRGETFKCFRPFISEELEVCIA